jgi:TrpR family transcriptional regulator, trp operon repressor
MKHDSLIDVCCSIDDPEIMKRFFSEIFTPAELDDMGKRWQLISELAEGRTQRDIAKRLHISLCKITRGAKILKDKNSVIRSVFVPDQK